MGYQLEKTGSGAFTIRDPKGKAVSYNLEGVIQGLGVKEIAKKLEKYEGKDIIGFLGKLVEEASEFNGEFEEVVEETLDLRKYIGSVAKRGEGPIVFEIDVDFYEGYTKEEAIRDVENFGGKALFVSFEEHKKAGRNRPSDSLVIYAPTYEKACRCINSIYGDDEEVRDSNEFYIYGS